MLSTLKYQKLGYLKEAEADFVAANDGNECAVVREAAVLGHHITPLFSYYAYHGPVFRVLLRLNRGKLHDRIMVLLAIATSVEIPMNFLGTDMVR
ncbi:tRNA (guanine(26)-N(2)/guanine(27)-N(2))-dimethyltransferase [Trifolium repens]|nr:tRNA (guanine(26)-N(2)/guanine(27)-N(2))-dimethyltransferase [Trifolium repens]